MKASTSKRVAPLDKREAIKRLRSPGPLSREFRNRLADYLVGNLHAKPGPSTKRRPLTVRTAIIVREWLNEETDRLRREHKEAQKKPGALRIKFDSRGARDTLARKWKIKSGDLESRIAAVLKDRGLVWLDVDDPTKNSHAEFD